MICNICESEFNPINGVCTNCGHVLGHKGGVPVYIPKDMLPEDVIRKRKNNKLFTATVLLSALLVVAVILSSVLAVAYTKINQDYERYYNMYNYYTDGAMRLRYFDENVVFVEDLDSGIFHVYQCDTFGTYAWMGHRSEAEAAGYKPCPDCHE